MTERRYYEAMSIVQYIIEGHSKVETGEEFGIRPQSVDKKLKAIGYTYADLVELREERKNKEAKV